MNTPQHKRYILTLAALFAVVWTIAAINPYDVADWALENVLSVLLVILLATTYKKFPFSRVSYTLMFIFLCLHEIGSHYTYAKVPYDDWFQSYLGFSLDDALGWQRNNFDRVIHFLYGLLIAYPIREVYLRIVDAKGIWGYLLPFNFALSTSLIFEFFEWGAAEIFGGELGIHYLGTQGDVWDAHKDMLLAGIGALIAMTITLLINYWAQRDFSREWANSLKIKHREPLGEDALMKMLDE